MTDCQPKLDVILLLDTSGSLQKLYETEKILSSQLVEFLPISSNGVHLGLIKYNGYPQTEFELNRHFAKEQLNEAIARMELIPGVTRTGSALNQAALLFKSARPDAKKLVVLFSDGISMDDPVEIAKTLRADQVEILVVSLSENAYMPELEQIADRPEHLFTKENFESLKTRIEAQWECGPKVPLIFNSTGEPTLAKVTTSLSSPVPSTSVTTTTSAIISTATTASPTSTTRKAERSRSLADPGNKLGVPLFSYISQWLTNKRLSVHNGTDNVNQTSFLEFTTHFNMITTEFPAKTTTAELNMLEEKLKADNLDNDNTEQLDEKFLMIPHLHLNDKLKADANDQWKRSLFWI